jgi:cytochrome c-type biogenesis protein CcmF
MTKAREVMREPDVNSGMITDIYISPLELRQGNHNPEGTKILSIRKGESAELEGFEISFTEFKMTPHGTGGDFSVGAVLHISKGDFNYTAIPELIINAEGRRAQSAIIPAHNPYGKEIKISLTAMNADDKRIDLIFQGFSESKNAGHSHNEQLIIEFSQKPFMSILWLGTILMLIGTVIALIQSTKAASA